MSTGPGRSKLPTEPRQQLTVNKACGNKLPTEPRQQLTVNKACGNKFRPEARQELIVNKAKLVGANSEQSLGRS